MKGGWLSETEEVQKTQLVLCWPPGVPVSYTGGEDLTIPILGLLQFLIGLQPPTPRALRPPFGVLRSDSSRGHGRGVKGEGRE